METKLCRRRKVQMNLQCLFATSDVLHLEEMHLESRFSFLASKGKVQWDFKMLTWCRQNMDWRERTPWMLCCVQFLRYNVCCVMDSLLWRILQCSEYPSGHVNWDFYGYRLAGMLTRQGGERVFECNLRSVKKRVPWDWQEERLSWLISLTLCLLLKPQLHHTAYCTAAAAQCPSQKQFKLLLTLPFQLDGNEEHCETAFCRGSLVWQWNKILG